MSAVRAPVAPAGRGERRWPRQRHPEFDSFAVLAVIGVLTIVALLGVIVAGRAKEPSRSAPPISAWVPAPPLASGLGVPVEIQPALGTAAASSTGGTDIADPEPVGAYNPTATPKATRTTAPSKTPSAAPAPLLTADSKISLQPADASGKRVRHRFMWVHVDQIGSNSSPTDRADATFTVRKGLADSRCFSFESVNSPRNFLRHQNYTLSLQGNDGSALFAQDATFCPVAGRKAGTMVFRAHNYPDRYLRERNDQIFLDQVSAEGATAFKAMPPL
jgi:hypothetical protein